MRHHADISRFPPSFHLLNLGILILLDLAGEKKNKHEVLICFESDISISMILFDLSMRNIWVSGMSAKYGSRYNQVVNLHLLLLFLKVLV